VRLLVTNTAQGVWVWLDPQTVEEMSALEHCTAQGEWTNGPGREAIPRLQALAARLGHPVGAPERQVTSQSRPRLVVVKQREHVLYRRLVAMRWPGVHVIMDRRQGERRTTDRPSAPDQRRRLRRRSPPTSWDTLRYLAVPTQERAS
jgi:hypothetical protein